MRFDRGRATSMSKRAGSRTTERHPAIGADPFSASAWRTVDGLVIESSGGVSVGGLELDAAPLARPGAFCRAAFFALDGSLYH